MTEVTEKRGVLSAHKRRERAAAELRANLAKRKALTRSKTREADNSGPEAASNAEPARE